MKIKIYKEDPDTIKRCVKDDPSNIHYFENPSEKIQFFVINTFGGSAIRYINPTAITEDVKIAAIKNNPGAIRYIENPSEKLKYMAVNTAGTAIKYIKDPSEELKLLAVKRTSQAIRFIENPSEKLQLTAIEGNPSLIAEIKNPTEKVQIRAIQLDREAYYDIIYPSEKVLFGYIKMYPKYAERVIRKPNLSEEIQLYSVKCDVSLIKYICNPADSVIKYVIENGSLSDIANMQFTQSRYKALSDELKLLLETTGIDNEIIS